jgi:phosphomannomutase
MQLNLTSRKTAFGKYDIRGVYPTMVDESLVRLVIGKLASETFARGKVVIGHDARLSSPSLYKVVREALGASDHLEIVDVGLMTTPALYFLVNDLDAEGGVMVTASHNLKEYNGLKVVGRGGRFVSGEDIYEMLR